MKVFELRDDWGLDHLHLGERPRPEPGPGQVVVAMGAASLNYRDHVMMDQGYGRRSGELPLIPISDGAGEIAASGDGVDRVAVGDLVCPSFSQHWISGPLKEEYWPGILGGPHDGVMQEFMLLDQSGVVRAPKGWDALHAATLPCAAITAWSAVVGEGRIEAGQTVLIQGSGGAPCQGHQQVDAQAHIRGLNNGHLGRRLLQRPLIGRAQAGGANDQWRRGAGGQGGVGLAGRWCREIDDGV